MSVRSLRAALLFCLFSQACRDPVSDSGATESLDGDIDGLVFKGPMATGAAVWIQPIGPSGIDLGEPAQTTVSDDGGSYTAHVSHQGLVRVTAEGPAFDEAQGAAGTTPITLVAYAELNDGDQRVQVNVLTDLAHRRVEALLGQGVPAAQAIADAQAELAASLPIGARVAPGIPGEQLDPFSEDAAASILFAQSAVLAQAGKNLEDQGVGSLGALMEELRADLADDGALQTALRETIAESEPTLDPDLATLSLAALVYDAGLDWIVPDIQPGLDSDQDGLLNSDDNCRYISNVDQADTETLGFGDACDFRLDSISTTSHWGCGVLREGGALVCWEQDAGPTGGTPPHPDVYPAHEGYPWRTGDVLSGAYDRVAVGDNIVCATGDDGLACWVSGFEDELTVDGEFRVLRAGGGMICALDIDGEATCLRNTGVVLTGEAGPWQDVTPIGDGGAVGIRADDGRLDWVSTEAFSGTLPELPAGSYQRAVATGASWGCALALADGALSCFGGAPMSDAAPAGRFSDLAVGAGIGCATDAAGALTWWRDASMCPVVEGAPDQLWNVSAGNCQICGTDADGLGQCWPRYWDMARAGSG